MDKTMNKIRGIVYFLIIQFILQFFIFAYFYVYILKIEKECKSRFDDIRLIRNKRSSAISTPEDNNVSESKENMKKKSTLGPFTSTSSPNIIEGQDWVWLNADTRIQLEAIQSVCESSKKYCSPGSPGDRGPPGAQGNLGPRGPPGSPGLSGVKGPKGDLGPPGLDGRDGIPGEPGLDGVPGRSGIDGIPGMDGRPGTDGIHGRPGRNGTDGMPGERGPIGPPGPPGIMGPTGPPGIAGRDGKPGVTTWNYSSTSHEDLLVPPSILEDPHNLRNNTMIVQEKLNVKLGCAASGNPRPLYQWTKVDGSPIPIGKWHVSGMMGSYLNITTVNRQHMGDYVCVADNGIPPKVRKIYKLRVEFPPYIKVKTPTVVVVQNKSSGILECAIEAFPEPTVYWERGGGDSRRGAQIIKSGDRFSMELLDRKDFYKLKMRLRIFRMHPSDSGLYLCVVRSGVHTLKGSIQLEVLNEDKKNIDKLRDGKQQQPVTYGEHPPELIDSGDFCPSRSNLNCPYANVVGGPIEIRTLANLSFGGLPQRFSEGVLQAIGKPVLKGTMDDHYGIWMHDACSKIDGFASDKFWVTRKDNSSFIFEYSSKEQYDRGIARPIKLPYPFQGNSHIVYNGSFFYNPESHASIYRYDLYPIGMGCGVYDCELHLPGLLIKTDNYLYTVNHNFNYVDFDADENGLWVIYSLPSNNTVVLKIDIYKMTIQYAWNISINHHHFGEMFIASGVLYAVHSVTDNQMKIRLAMDLYKNAVVDVNLSISNPYGKTTALSYNHKTKEIYTWDKGSQLGFPIKYNGPSKLGSRDDPAK